jgi:hypothetical protein
MKPNRTSGEIGYNRIVRRKVVDPQSGPTRRQWLRWLQGGAAAVMARRFAGCGDNIDGTFNPQDATAMIHEQDHRGFVVAVWSRFPGAALIEVEDRFSGVTVATQPIMIGSSGSGVGQFANLPSNREFNVRVLLHNGLQLQPYRAVTAPRSDQTAPLAMHVTADFDLNPLFESGIFSHMSDLRPDFTMTLGDFPYADNGPAAISIEDYRRVHAEMRTAPKIASWLRSTGIRAIYDDHEFRNNWAPRFVNAEPDRYAAAMQTWDEFFPIPQAPPEIRYRKWSWGASVDGFILDCRRFRQDIEVADGPDKSMLGAEQKRWLLQGLAQSRAAFKLVSTSVALDFSNTGENWSAFVDEREEIFDAIKAANIEGVLFLAGDSHWFAAHRHKSGAREFQVGPAARSYHTPPAAVPEVLMRAITYNFGRIDIVNNNLRFRAIDGDGAELYAETLTPESMRLR